ncbi:MAG: hypothetical protein U0223_00330, partial [Nitrospira sp.]
EEPIKLSPWYMPHQLWYGQTLNPRHHIIHSGQKLVKHAEILTGGMALILPPAAGASHHHALVPQKRAAPLPTSRSGYDSIHSLTSHAALTQTYVFNRIITSRSCCKD